MRKIPCRFSIWIIFLSVALAVKAQAQTQTSSWVRIREQTWFKSLPIDSANLALATQKCQLLAGDGLYLWNPPVLEGNHVRVHLANPIPGCQFTEGYFFFSHVDAYPPIYPPQPPVTVTDFWAKVATRTWFKIQPKDSSELQRGTGKCELQPQDVLYFTKYPLVDGNQIRVQLANPIPGCRFTDGFLFVPHLTDYTKPPQPDGPGDFDPVLGLAYAQAAVDSATPGSLGRCYAYVWRDLKAVVGAAAEESGA